MLLINTSGGVAGSYTYDPYGKTTVTSGTSTTAAQANPFRYTGGYQDSTGYYHLGARYYDTAGHFTQADPIAGDVGRAEQYNGYTYTGGQPANKTDLSGESYNSGLEVAAFGAAAVGLALFLAFPPAGLAAAGFGAQAAVTAGVILDVSFLTISGICLIKGGPGSDCN